MITLSTEECEALYGLINQLSGCNAGNVFLGAEPIDILDPTISACVKVYREAGKGVPDDLKDCEDLT